MQVELRHVSPLRAANIVALLYALSMLIMIVPMFVMLSLVPEPASANPEQPALSLSSFRWLLVLYPAFGLVFGWLAGLVGSWLYNLIAGRLGGFELDLLSSDPAPRAPAA